MTYLLNSIKYGYFSTGNNPPHYITELLSNQQIPPDPGIPNKTNYSVTIRTRSIGVAPCYYTQPLLSLPQYMSPSSTFN